VRLLADENVPRASIRKLRSAGHEVLAVAEELSGLPDADVLRVAAEREALLITFDSDFGTLIFRGEPIHTAGIVFLRFIPRSPEEPAELLLSVLDRFEGQLQEHFSVVDRDRIRQRELPGR